MLKTAGSGEARFRHGSGRIEPGAYEKVDFRLNRREGGSSSNGTPNRRAERLSAKLEAVSARPETFRSTKEKELCFDGRRHLRLDCLPPSGNSRNASKNLELPPTKRDDLKAPGKKSGTTIKKEKPKRTPPRIKGAERWRDCPAEFLKYAREGLVSARVTIPGPGFVLKEAAISGPLFITEAPDDFEKLDSTPQNSTSTNSPSKRTKAKGKLK